MHEGRGAEERQRYLAQVRGGRRVPHVDPTGPRYTVAAEEQRQAQALGLGGAYAARQAAGTHPMDPAAQRDQIVEALMAQGRTPPVEAPVSPPGGWNPFAGGVHGPAGQVVGAGADAMATMGRWLREQLPNRMPSFGARPAPPPLQSMPGYNRDENAQLQQLERGR